MRTPRSLILLAAIALSSSGCLRPGAVTEAANIASLRLAVMDAQARRQQQVVNTQRATLAQSVAESRERALVFASLSEDWPVIWRALENDETKRKIRFLNELKARDEALIADPYLLVRKPPAPVVAQSTADVAGLKVAIESLERLGGDQALSAREVAAILFEMLAASSCPSSRRPTHRVRAAQPRHRLPPRRRLPTDRTISPWRLDSAS